MKHCNYVYSLAERNFKGQTKLPIINRKQKGTLFPDDKLSLDSKTPTFNFSYIVPNICQESEKFGLAPTIGYLGNERAPSLALE